jgi:hypothetical protein
MTFAALYTHDRVGDAQPHTGLQRPVLDQQLYRAPPRSTLRVYQPASESTLVPYQSTGYFNPRVTVTVDNSVAFEVTHLKFTPVPEARYIAAEACLAGEPGADCSPSVTADAPAASP